MLIKKITKDVLYEKGNDESIKILNAKSHYC